MCDVSYCNNIKDLSNKEQMSLTVQQSALIECSESNGYLFQTCEEGDVLFYAGNNTQKIHIGGGWNINPTVTIDQTKLGINVVNPTAHLHVGGNVNIENGTLTFNHTISGDRSAVTFRHNTSDVGSIIFGTTGTQYNTVSDYRLKSIEGNTSNALASMCSIPVYNYIYKDDPRKQHHVGCIAHEIQKVAPWVVAGDKDGSSYQTVDYSKLVPMLIASVQELNNRIHELTFKN